MPSDGLDAGELEPLELVLDVGAGPLDTPVAGLRERDPRNGMKELLAGSIFAKLPFVPQLFARPGWLAAFLLDGGLPKLEAPSESARSRDRFAPQSCRLVL